MNGYTLPNIALLGKAGAGKDAVAVELRCYGYARFALADPLKQMLGVTNDRALMQSFGVGVRALHEDAWVNLLMHRVHEAGSVRPIVVTDVRFPNEVQRLREDGFLVVRVDADRNRRLARLQANGKIQDEAALEHVSETILDGEIPDYLLDNNGSWDELKDGVLTILNAERL